jgi:hypothetical protein
MDRANVSNVGSRTVNWHGPTRLMILAITGSAFLRWSIADSIPTKDA